MSNYYQASIEQPFHLSIGAVPVNKGKIMCHHFKEFGPYKNFYVLPTETMEQGETIEQTLHRGLMEEMGITSKVKEFLGSEIYPAIWFTEISKPTNVVKTVLYFLVEVENFDNSKRLKGEIESETTITEFDIEELIKIMEDQSKRIPVKEVNQIEILLRAKKFINL